MARGIDLEAVTPRFASKSIGCCKKFPGRNSIKGIATLTHWLTELAKEVVERLEKDEIENNRVAKQIVVSFTQQFTNEEVASTRCIPLHHIDVEIIVQDSLDVIKRNTEVFFKNEQNTVISNPITLLGISAGKFEEHNLQKRNTIKDMFSKAIVNDTAKKSADNSNVDVSKPPSSRSDSKPSNIKSFFSAAKDDEVSEMDENEPPIVYNFDCDGTSSMNETPVAVNDSKDPEEERTSIETKISDQNESMTNSVPKTPKVVNDLQTPGPSNQSDYTTTYVEFQRPEIPDDFFEICSQCNKKLLIVEMQSHLDMHLAFKLSQEQRIEFRSQLKTTSSKPSTSSPVAKKLKLDRSLTVSNASGSKVGDSSGKGALTKYLTQRTDNVPESSVKCDECGKFIGLESVVEHSDYHTAKKLQMEINSSNGGVVSGNTSSKNTNAKSRADSKKRSIAAFFKSTN